MSKADKMFEEWATCKNFEGLYEVSNLGRVKSLRRYKNNNSKKQLVEEKILSAHRNKNNGYEYVYLSKDGKGYNKRVHRLVLESFVGVDIYRDVVNHKNGVRHDNRLSNLEWCTQKENILKGHEFNETYKKDEFVVARYNEGFSQKEIARVMGMTPPGVREILKRNNELQKKGGWIE